MKWPSLHLAMENHDAARKDLLVQRINELKGMLFRFCEKALTTLSDEAKTEIERRVQYAQQTADSEDSDLDRYNIYGDVNVESAVSKMKRGFNLTTKQAGKQADSVAMRLQHMKRHAGALTFGSKKADETTAETEDPFGETSHLGEGYRIAVPRHLDHKETWRIMQRELRRRRRRRR